AVARTYEHGEHEQHERDRRRSRARHRRMIGWTCSGWFRHEINFRRIQPRSATPITLARVSAAETYGGFPESLFTQRMLSNLRPIIATRNHGTPAITSAHTK